jgi:hypothetical protein
MRENRLILVETERGLEVDEEPYSCTVTIPDDASAKVSARSRWFS